MSENIADRYISPSGKTPNYDQAHYEADLMTTISFMICAEDADAYFGGESAKSAYAAMCRLLDLDGVKVRKIMKGEI